WAFPYSNNPTSKGYNSLILTWNRVNLAALEISLQEISNHIWNYT
ncbi:hypothetical protein MTR67_011634, partial [Solanum verrucosum]